MALPRGSKVQHPQAQGYQALLDDLYLRLAVSPDRPLRIYTQDSLAQRQDDRGSVYENVLDLGYMFARTDLSGGEGLDWDPRLISVLQDEQARDQIRFWDSLNIDVSRPARGQRYVVTLAHDFESFITLAANARDMAASNDHIYAAHGQVIRWYDGWDNAVEIGNFDNTATNVDMIAANVHDDVAYVGADGDIYYKPQGGAFALSYNAGVGEPIAIKIWWAKDRWLIEAEDTAGIRSLREYDSQAGTIATIIDTTLDTAPFNSVVNSGPAIVAATGDGTLRSYVPDETGALVNRARVAMPVGEEAILLGSNANVLLIMTRATEHGTNDATIRLYTAEVLDSRFDYAVGNIDLIREWTGTDEAFQNSKRFVATRDELWFAIEESDNQSYVWRFDVVTGGLSRYADTSITGQVEGLVHYEDKVGFFNQATIYNEADTYQTSGYVILPNVTFGLNTPINWIANVLEVQSITGTGGKVELWRSSDPKAILNPNDSSWILVRTVTNDLQSGTENPMLGVTSRTQAFMLKIYPSTTRTQTPEFSRVGVRGLPKHRDWIVELPINISDYIEVPGRLPIRIPGFGDMLHEAVLAYEGAHVELTLYDPPLQFRGVVDRLVEPVTYMTSEGSVTEAVVLQLRGSRVIGTSSAAAVFGLGIGTMGIATIGVETES